MKTKIKKNWLPGKYRLYRTIQAQLDGQINDFIDIVLTATEAKTMFKLYDDLGFNEIEKIQEGFNEKES